MRTPRDDAPPPGSELASRRAADTAGKLLKILVERGEDRRRAQRFVLQCVYCCFAGTCDLQPPGSFTAALGALDPLLALFRRAHVDAPQGLFTTLDPPPLRPTDLPHLACLAAEDWHHVDPPIFGALFESSLGHPERHALGAHYTSESDILIIIGPTIERPWIARIDAAPPDQLPALHAELSTFRVLDPACGSGNFLYYAYRALLRLESRILARLPKDSPQPHPSRIRLDQLHGIDIDPLALELTRTTLLLARARLLGPRSHDRTPPNLHHADALLAPWPPVDAIIGNPPFLDARKFAASRPPADLHALRARYPDVPRRADLCVYWFRRAHDHLAPGQRAGLVGTNTIRQNYSREGGLDHIVRTGGTITDAVATQVWSGDAAVHVSIVNWIRGEHPGPRTLATQLGDTADSPWRVEHPAHIPASLRAGFDVSTARPLAACAAPFCFEGIQPGHRGFRLTADQAAPFLADPRARPVLSRYLTGDALLAGTYHHSPEYLIDLPAPLADAAAHPALLAHLERLVLPDWRRNADAEFTRTAAPTGEHQNRLKIWWHLKRPRPDLQAALRRLTRYIACARVTRRPIFAFIASTIKPDSSLTVFAAEDDYSFGILQSDLHWQWFQARCSTLKRDFRYTSNTVFDAFAWPQSPTLAQAHAVAAAAVALRAARDAALPTHRNLRALHRERLPELKIAQQTLDLAVQTAYGMPPDADPLAFLLALNHTLAARESHHHPVTPPGLPPCVTDPRPFITPDSIRG